MTPADLAFATAAEFSAAVRGREVSVREVAEACLDRIDRVDRGVNAWLTVEPEAVLREANRLDSQAPDGALVGVPVGIKDLTPTAGLRTTYGSVRFRDHVPERDAVIVQRIRDRGGLILGKTNTPEHGVGGNTFNRRGDPQPVGHATLRRRLQRRLGSGARDRDVRAGRGQRHRRIAPHTGRVLRRRRLRDQRRPRSRRSRRAGMGHAVGHRSPVPWPGA